MIKISNDFNLDTNKNSVIICKKSTSKFVKQIDEKLNNALTSIKPSSKIHTLGNFDFEYVYLCEDINYVIDNLTNVKENVVLLLDTFEFNDEDILKLSETIKTSRYAFTKYKDIQRNEHEFKIVTNEDITELANTGIVFANAINTTKDFVNTPHIDFDAVELAEIAVNLDEKYEKITTVIYNKKEIEEMGMNSFLSVNRGSEVPPKFIYLKYQGKKEWKDPIALVGKGVMFDTGGYSIKPKTGIFNMKTDMAGAASVLAAIEAIAELNIKENIIVAVAATDNAISPLATYPDDVVISMKGLTIEINNTDAEGRLTLCDALTFVQQEGAKKVIDVATLTGGVITALGSDITGAFTNSKELLKEVQKAANKSEEKIWELPVEPFRKAVRERSKIADLHNSPGGEGHASLAAAFLREFIEDGTEWVHLDIAGTSSKGMMATGVITKTLINFFR